MLYTLHVCIKSLLCIYDVFLIIRIVRTADEIGSDSFRVWRSYWSHGNVPRFTVAVFVQPVNMLKAIELWTLSG